MQLYVYFQSFGVLLSALPTHTHSPLAILAKCLGDDENFSLGAAKSLVTIIVVGAKLCLAQWVLPNSDHKQTPHEDQEQGALWASHYFQLGGFP